MRRKNHKTLKRFTIVSLLVLLLILAGVRTEPSLAFINGQIITMDANNRVVQAMLVEGGRISELGTTSAIGDKITSSTRVTNLHGRTVVPGFIDAHSHFPASGIRAVSVDLSPPPTGTTDSLENLLDQLSQATKHSSRQDWLLGFNYDNTVLTNGEHPTRNQLDRVAPDHPVYLWHNSGHMGVANSQALSRLSIDESSIAPAGGVLGRDQQTGLLNGLLQETAAPPLTTIVSKFSFAWQLRVLTSARDDYLAHGVTTIQNGYAGLNMMRVLRFAKKLGLIPQRIIVWPAHAKNNHDRKINRHDFSHVGSGTNMESKNVHSGNARSNKARSNLERFKLAQFDYKVGAIKILVDGSPQGMTAYLSEPYFNTTNKPVDYRGFALIDQQVLTEMVSHYHTNGYQLALHGNGDAAIEYIINAVEIAQQRHPRPDARHIMVHAQTIRQDQLARLNALSLSPSFFTSHTFYWGDWHRKMSLGPRRAANISPARWASEIGVRYTLHTDAPVTPMKPMQMLWSATNRQTISGYELGPHQRIDIETALRAITIDAAWQNHVDDSVGSLEVGKLADMVVLSQSPIHAADVREIEVLTTYIDGVQHYTKPVVLGTD